MGAADSCSEPHLCAGYISALSASVYGEIPTLHVHKADKDIHAYLDQCDEMPGRTPERNSAGEFDYIESEQLDSLAHDALKDLKLLWIFLYDVDGPRTVRILYFRQHQVHGVDVHDAMSSCQHWAYNVVSHVRIHP